MGRTRSSRNFNIPPPPPPSPGNPSSGSWTFEGREVRDGRDSSQSLLATPFASQNLKTARNGDKYGQYLTNITVIKIRLKKNENKVMFTWRQSSSHINRMRQAWFWPFFSLGEYALAEAVVRFISDWVGCCRISRKRTVVSWIYFLLTKSVK